MRALIKEPGKDPEEREIQNELKEIQKIVGGPGDPGELGGACGPDRRRAGQRTGGETVKEKRRKKR